MNEIDMIIHWMRQSKMSDIREELEKVRKTSLMKNCTAQEEAANFLSRFKELFKTASKDAPMP